MSKKKHLSLLFFGLITILLLSGFTHSTLIEKGNSLPPRPTAVPAPKYHPKGGQIQLILENEIDEIPTDLWTVVEWQDTNTNKWYIVEGWQGSLDTATSQTWWVGADMLGDGPFRWQLYESKDGELLTTSESFRLPALTGAKVVVIVSLE